MFDRFSRVTGAMTDTYPLIGLDLHISAEIVRRQGGRIWVESKGDGVTFGFWIPISPGGERGAGDA